MDWNLDHFDTSLKSDWDDMASSFLKTSSLFFVDAKFEFWSFLFYCGCWTWGLQTSFWRSTWSLSQETFFECLDLSNFWPREKMSVKRVVCQGKYKEHHRGGRRLVLDTVWGRDNNSHVLAILKWNDWGWQIVVSVSLGFACVYMMFTYVHVFKLDHDMLYYNAMVMMMCAVMWLALSCWLLLLIMVLHSVYKA